MQPLFVSEDTRRIFKKHLILIIITMDIQLKQDIIMKLLKETLYKNINRLEKETDHKRLKKNNKNSRTNFCNKHSRMTARK